MARRVNRRTVLKGIGAIAAAPLVGAGCTPGTTGSTPPDATLEELVRQRIDTVVLLMMENRSFDHFLGALSLVEGRPGVDGLQASMSNPDPDGASSSVHPADELCTADPGHGWDPSHSQWNDGRNDGFVLEHAERYGSEAAHVVMGYFDRATLPAMYTLADQFTVCDRWFCSVLGPTWPNRFYSLAGTSNGLRGNVNSPDEYPSIFDRLDVAGRSWADYAGNLPFPALLPGRSLEHPEFRALEDFFTDAANGALPSFSLVEPIYGRNDDHPPAHPVAGQVLISAVYKALSESPQWNRSLLILTYDEHGGFFDHVPPPTTEDERAAEGFGRLGFRVPTIVIGPYVTAGRVSSTVYDHTSVLAFLRRLYGLEPLTQRDRVANDMLELFDEAALRAGTPREAPALPVIEADEGVIYAPTCVNPNVQGSLAPGAIPGGRTTQPALEAWFDAHYPGHPKVRYRRSEELYRQFLERAKAMQVLRTR